MTTAEIAHTAADSGRFRSWGASHSGPSVVNRPDLGSWSMAQGGRSGEASLTAQGGDLLYAASASMHGFLWRADDFRPLTPGAAEGVRAGDRYLLCTEGILSALGEAALARIVAADEDAPAERLVLAALAAGAAGSVAAIAIEVVAEVP